LTAGSAAAVTAGAAAGVCPASGAASNAVANTKEREARRMW